VEFLVLDQLLVVLQAYPVSPLEEIVPLKTEKKRPENRTQPEYESPTNMGRMNM